MYRPLFIEEPYFINFNKVTAPTSSTAITAFITSSGKITIIGATIADLPLTFRRYRMFVLQSGALNFYVLKNILFPNC